MDNISRRILGNFCHSRMCWLPFKTLCVHFMVWKVLLRHVHHLPDGLWHWLGWNSLALAGEITRNRLMKSADSKITAQLMNAGFRTFEAVFRVDTSHNLENDDDITCNFRVYFTVIWHTIHFSSLGIQLGFCCQCFAMLNQKCWIND